MTIEIWHRTRAGLATSEGFVERVEGYAAAGRRIEGLRAEDAEREDGAPLVTYEVREHQPEPKDPALDLPLSADHIASLIDGAARLWPCQLNAQGQEILRRFGFLPPTGVVLSGRRRRSGS